MSADRLLLPNDLSGFVGTISEAGTKRATGARKNSLVKCPETANTQHTVLVVTH